MKQFNSVKFWTRETNFCDVDDNMLNKKNIFKSVICSQLPVVSIAMFNYVCHTGRQLGEICTCKS